jgi:hypothetical protein
MNIGHDFQSDSMVEYIKSTYLKNAGMSPKKRNPAKLSLPFNQPNQKKEIETAFISRSKICRTPYRE